MITSIIVEQKEIKEEEEEKPKDNKNNKEILEEEINIQNIPFSREAKEKDIRN